MGMSAEHYMNTIVGNHAKNFVLLDTDLSYNLSMRDYPSLIQFAE